MKKTGLVFSFLLLAAMSFAQFTDTAQLNNFIRDTIKDRRPEKVTAADLQKAFLGVSYYTSSLKDSSYSRNDSVFVSRNGVEYFVHVDRFSTGNGNTLDVNATKQTLKRIPYIYGDTVFFQGNSWVLGGFTSGTPWPDQLCTYLGKIKKLHATNGDDTKGLLAYGYKNIAGNATNKVYILDFAYVDITGINPWFGGAYPIYGRDDSKATFRKSIGTFKAYLANYYLDDEWHSFYSLGNDGGNFIGAGNKDSLNGKSTTIGDSVMKGIGTYHFVKPVNKQSLVIAFYNTDSLTYTGGIINVYVKGKLAESVNTNNGNNGGKGAGSWVYRGLGYDCIILHNLPADTATITVETTTANVWLDYYGYIVPYTKTQKPVYINTLGYPPMGSTTPLFTWTARTRATVDSFNLAKKIAASYFENYPVFIVDMNKTLNPATDWMNDKGHVNASGNNRYFEYFKNNLVPTYPQFGARQEDFTNSLKSDGSKVQLVGDELSPTAWKFYGTNASDNNRGFHPFPGSFSGSIAPGKFDDTLTIGSARSIVNRAQLDDDFLGSNASGGGSAFFSKLITGTGADVLFELSPNTIAGGTATGVGYLRFTTGTTTTGSAALNYTGTGGNVFGKVDTNYYYRIKFQGVIVEDLSDGTNTYSLEIGLGQVTANSGEIQFKYSSAVSGGNWTCNSQNGVATETTDAGVTVAADTKYDLEIELYNGVVKFYINGILKATHTTQVPAHGAILYSPLARVLKSLGATARLMYIDRVRFRYDHESNVN